MNNTYQAIRTRETRERRVERRVKREGLSEGIRITELCDVVEMPSFHGSVVDGKYVEIPATAEIAPGQVVAFVKTAMSKRVAEDQYDDDFAVIGAQAEWSGPLVITGFGKSYKTRGGGLVKRAYVRAATAQEFSALPSVAERWDNDWSTSLEEMQRSGFPMPANYDDVAVSELRSTHYLDLWKLDA